MKEKQRYHVGIGVPSILMIFVVLCLTTFGVLSYSSAAADHRLTEKNIEYMKAYYEADAQAQEMLRQVDHVLQEQEVLIQTAEDVSQKNIEYLENVKAVLYEMAVVVRESGDELKVSWKVPVTEERDLSVVITVFSFDQTERYSIEEYCLVQSDIFEAAGAMVIEEEGNAGLWQGGN